MQSDLICRVENWMPYASNTFSGRGRGFATLLPVHHVNPHHVQGHFRQGKYISGYWRDGDGNTRVNTYRGYYAKNPNAAPIVAAVRKRGRLL